ncbi:MAG: hypothetical protein OEW12_06950 [Deltaproteobacteria bacterium]|nr:hypothetical protein [Deltaproteobacteria bacterium]
MKEVMIPAIQTMVRLFNGGRFTAAVLIGGVIWGLGLPAVSLGQTHQVPLTQLYQTDIRAMAMGNAYGPVARGEGALLYNPAGLAQFDADVKLEASLAAESGSIPFLQDTFALFGGPGVSSPTMVKYLTKYHGTIQDFRYQTFHSIVINLAKFYSGFGYATMTNKRYSLQFQDTVANGTVDPGDTLIWNETYLSAQFVGGALALWDGKLLMGATQKQISYEEKPTAVTYASLLASGSLSTTAVGTTYQTKPRDLGMLYRMEAFSSLRGMWSLTALNLGGATLTSPTGNLNSPLMVNTGLSFAPKFGPLELILAGEVEDILDAGRVWNPVLLKGFNRSLAQRTHYGAELGLFQTTTGNHIFSVRGGYNRGLPVYGAEINLFSVLRVAYVHFQDDWGYKGAPARTKTTALHVGIGFGF